MDSRPLEELEALYERTRLKAEHSSSSAVQMAEEEQKQEVGTGNFDQERFNKQIAAAQKAQAAQQKADGLKQKASKLMNGKERQRMLQDAYDREVEAHGHSKFAKSLQSGPLQGGAAGAGIGVGVGAGLGTVVGTLVTGLVSVPTFALGGLIGLGVGGIHGPFFKFDNHKKSPEQNKQEALDKAKELDDAVDRSSNAPIPPNFDGATVDSEGADVVEKKKPRKLDSRSASVVPSSPTAEKKKPRKIEVRSGGDRKENA